MKNLTCALAIALTLSAVGCSSDKKEDISTQPTVTQEAPADVSVTASSNPTESQPTEVKSLGASSSGMGH